MARRLLISIVAVIMALLQSCQAACFMVYYSAEEQKKEMKCKATDTASCTSGPATEAERDATLSIQLMIAGGQTLDKIQVSRWPNSNSCDVFANGLNQMKSPQLYPPAGAHGEIDNVNEMYIDYAYEAAVENAREDRAIARLALQKSQIESLRGARRRKRSRYN